MVRYWYWYALSPVFVVFGTVLLLSIPPLALIALLWVAVLALRGLAWAIVWAARALGGLSPKATAPVHAYAYDQGRSVS